MQTAEGINPSSAVPAQQCLDAWRAPVDAAIEAALIQPRSPLTEAALRIATSGGKRFRARIVMSAAAAVALEWSDVVADRLVAAAASVELLHAGSLVHDDILDEATVRRGVSTINARESNTWAVLAGDMILARGSVLAAQLGQREAMLYGALLDALCLGQALETATLDSCQRTERDYLAAIEGKTAALIAGACRLGGMQVTDAEAYLAALDSFGRSFGLAFQLLDDIADVVLSDEELGKPSMQDLREGVITHPVICALRDDPAFERIVVGVRSGNLSLAGARDVILAKGCTEETRLYASRFTEDARRALVDAKLPGDPGPLCACIDDYLAPLLACTARQSLGCRSDAPTTKVL